MTLSILARLAAISGALAAACPVAGAECRARSGAERVPVLELYTSEGCDSCPPADRWLSGVAAAKLAPGKVVPLAFHVDYWNQLGWPDRFAQPRFGERQRELARLKKAGFVFTPQILLDGQDYRRGWIRDDVGSTLATINRSRPAAELELSLMSGGDTITVNASVKLPAVQAAKTAHAFLALTESRLATDVRAGENRGKRLEHDFVVRELVGPVAFSEGAVLALTHEFRVGADWKREQLAVAAFVQDRATGATLQALAVAGCR
ncbi:MAG: DUF1223 domain-containing protein [Burkholderiales bacterium]